MTVVLGVLLMQGCASIGRSHHPRAEAVAARPSDTLSMWGGQDVLGDGESALRPLATGAYAWDARMTIIQQAQRTLDVQYYLLKDDGSGRAFLRALRDAAGRGVRVRLLVDDLYTISEDALLANFAAIENVEVRLFNPFPMGRSTHVTRWGLSLFDVARLNHRMHNKLMIADGAMAIVGRNIADEYFLRSTDGNFIDFDLLIAGAAVPELAAAFDAYWNSPRVFDVSELEPGLPDEMARRIAFDVSTKEFAAAAPGLAPSERDLLGYGPLSGDIGHPPLKMVRARIQVFADDPEKVSGQAESGADSTTVTSQVLDAINRAREDLLLVSPYFVPGKLGMENIGRGRQQGVAVTLVTNSLAANDEPYVSAAFARYRKPLLKMGVQVHEVSPEVLDAGKDRRPRHLATTSGRLHVKGAVIDRRWTFVGSMNMDFRSSRVNTEIGVLVDSPEFAADVAGLIDRLHAMGMYRLRLSPETQDIEWVEHRDGKEVVHVDEPGVDWVTRLKIFTLFPFISETLL